MGGWVGGWVGGGGARCHTLRWQIRHPGNMQKGLQDIGRPITVQVEKDPGTHLR